MSAQIFRKCEHPKFVHGRLRNCGRCVACLGRRNAELMTRVRLDLRTYGQKRWLKNKICIRNDFVENRDYRYTARFIHLTYADDRLPENGSIVKAHLQKYLKRVRERIYEATGVKSIASINAGEYGEKKGRPHYHIFMWRLPEFQGLFNILVDCWKKSDDGKNCRISVNRIYGNAIKAATYCAGYSTKGSRKYDRRADESADDYIRRTGREPPFVSWSHGIGLEYLEENEKMLLKNGFIITDEGKRLAFPRYYRKKLLEKQGFESFHNEFYKQMDMWKKYDVHFSATDEEIAFLFVEKQARMKTQKEYQKEYNSKRYYIVKLIDWLCDGGNPWCSEYARYAALLGRFVNEDYEKWTDEDKKVALSKYMRAWRECHESDRYESYMFWLSFYFSALPDRVRRHVIAEIPYYETVYKARDIIHSFERFLQKYNEACQKYDEKIVDAVKQQALNYRRFKEIKNANKYKDTARYDDVIDKENDLPCIAVRKRRRSRKNVLDY